MHNLSNKVNSINLVLPHYGHVSQRQSDKNRSGPVRIIFIFWSHVHIMAMVGLEYRRKPNLTRNFYPIESISGQLDSFISLYSQFL